jgi:hypothetical protein
MPARKARQIRPALRIVTPDTGPADGSGDATERAVTELGRAVDLLVTAPILQLLVADLVVGLNRVPHALGRAPRSLTVTPTVASSSFSAAYDPGRDGNPAPHREVWITLTGVAQPRAQILFVLEGAR